MILRKKQSGVRTQIATLIFISCLLIFSKVYAGNQGLRVVSLAPSWSHTVAEIGGINYLVGVSRYAKLPEEIPKRVAEGRLATVGGFSDISIENVLALEPDLVLTASTLQQSIHQQLSQKGIDTIHMDEDNLAGVFHKFRLLGQYLGMESGAEKMIQHIGKDVAGVQTKYNYTKEPKVYYELNYYYKCVPGKASPISEVIELAGGTPIFAELEGNSPLVNWDEVVEANPDVILIPTWPDAKPPVFDGDMKGSGTTTLEEMYSREGAEKISAIRNNRVWFIDSATSKQPGPLISEAIWLFADLIHKIP